MRALIFNKLKEIGKVYNTGKSPGQILEPTMILKYNNQLPSVNNSKYGFQRLEVMCYIPINQSITLLSNLTDNVKARMKELDNVEDMGEITPEFVDNEMQGIMRSLYFRIPKEVR